MIYPLSLHDALPISTWAPMKRTRTRSPPTNRSRRERYVRFQSPPPLPPPTRSLPLLGCREYVLEILERLGAHPLRGKSIPGDRRRLSSQPPPQPFVSPRAY